jgi:hypothetical protein
MQISHLTTDEAKKEQYIEIILENNIGMRSNHFNIVFAA